MAYFIFSMSQTARQTNSKIAVTENSLFLMQKVEDIVKGATQINSPPAGAGPSTTLSVNTSETSENPNIFDLVDGVVRLKRGSADPVPLTNMDVVASSLSFQRFDYSTRTKSTIRFRVHIQSKDNTLPASSSVDYFISIQ
jgi:hypothetical protein